MDLRTVFFFSACTLFQLSISDASIITTKRAIEEPTLFFVSTRSASDGQVEKVACKCVPYYICKKEDSFQIPDDPNACGNEIDVCCRVITPLSADPDPTSTANTSQEPPCQCESNSECELTGSSGGGLTAKSSQVECGIDEICCLKRITDPYATSTANASEEPPCQCVLSSECELVGNSGGGLTTKSSQVECGNDEVCCLRRTTEGPTRKCGERTGSIDVRILALLNNSTSTDFGEFPFMASVWAPGDSSDEFVCGASLIASNMLLTAAHCVRKRDSRKLRVRVRDYNIRAETPEEVLSHQEKPVSTIIIHYNFNLKPLMNDLAIIVTKDAFELDFYTFPACTVLYGSQFADSNMYNSSKCLALGWGRSSADDNAKLSNTLKKVELELVPSDQCQKLLRTTILGSGFNLDSSFVCATGLKGSDTCKGDGGGPLVCPLHADRHQYVQVGVTAAGVGCNNGIPGMYASLEANKDWISSIYDKYKSPK